MTFTRFDPDCTRCEGTGEYCLGCGFATCLCPRMTRAIHGLAARGKCDCGRAIALQHRERRLADRERRRQTRISKPHWLPRGLRWGAVALVAYVAFSWIAYRFRHPDQSGTELFLNFVEAVTWK